MCWLIRWKTRVRVPGQTSKRNNPDWRVMANYVCMWLKVLSMTFILSIDGLHFFGPFPSQVHIYCLKLPAIGDRHWLGYFPQEIQAAYSGNKQLWGIDFKFLENNPTLCPVYRLIRRKASVQTLGQISKRNMKKYSFGGFLSADFC